MRSQADPWGTDRGDGGMECARMWPKGSSGGSERAVALPQESGPRGRRWAPSRRPRPPAGTDRSVGAPGRGWGSAFDTTEAPAVRGRDADGGGEASQCGRGDVRETKAPGGGGHVWQDEGGGGLRLWVCACPIHSGAKNKELESDGEGTGPWGAVPDVDHRDPRRRTVALRGGRTAPEGRAARDGAGPLGERRGRGMRVMRRRVVVRPFPSLRVYSALRCSSLRAIVPSGRGFDAERPTTVQRRLGPWLLPSSAGKPSAELKIGQWAVCFAWRMLIKHFPDVGSAAVLVRNADTLFPANEDRAILAADPHRRCVAVAPFDPPSRSGGEGVLLTVNPRGMATKWPSDHQHSHPVPPPSPLSLSWGRPGLGNAAQTGGRAGSHHPMRSGGCGWWRRGGASQVVGGIRGLTLGGAARLGATPPRRGGRAYC